MGFSSQAWAIAVVCHFLQKVLRLNSTVMTSPCMQFTKGDIGYYRRLAGLWGDYLQAIKHHTTMLEFLVVYIPMYTTFLSIA